MRRRRQRKASIEICCWMQSQENACHGDWLSLATEAGHADS